ncbi:hypothetical protein B4U84_20620 [Westiellopsis prolifica IICB1]|nr:hypothetical protein B4U84_20620 [Westiellopsis prolifica IICB1]
MSLVETRGTWRLYNSQELNLNVLTLRLNVPTVRLNVPTVRLNVPTVRLNVPTLRLNVPTLRLNVQISKRFLLPCPRSPIPAPLIQCSIFMSKNSRFAIRTSLCN